MTETSEDARLPYAERVAKLLRKAEVTDNQHEADAFFEKAQELMTRYALDEEIMNAVRGLEAPDKIVRKSWNYAGIFHMCLFKIGKTVAGNNECQVLISKLGNKTGITVIGFSKDVERVKLLDASVQLQAAVAMKSWWRREGDRFRNHSAFDKAKERRAFLYGYATGLGVKLAQARDSAVTAAAADHKMDRRSTELVLVTKKRKVDDWLDQEYGRSLRRVKNNYSSGGYGSRVAGHAAGKNANTSTGSGGIGRRVQGELGR